MKKEKETSTRNLVLLYILYGLLFALFIFKMFFYANEINDVPDQIAHLSYVIYLEEHPEKIIPQFENVKLYEMLDQFQDGNSTITVYEKTNDTIYMSHPPFYYKFMQLCDVVEVSAGRAYVNTEKLCGINIFITSLTMILILLTGFHKLLQYRVDWTIHFLFAAICTCLPLYGYVGSGVNNDNLCNLAMVIFWMGLISYIDNRYCVKTYWLIAAGLILSVCSKLTAGLIILLVSTIIVLADIFVNKKATIICNKYFLMTIPAYVIVLCYFVIIYSRYGSFQPSYIAFVTDEEYKASMFYVEEAMRTNLTLGESIKYYCSSLLSTWMGTYSIRYGIYRTGILAFPFTLVLLLFLVWAIVGLCKFLKNRELGTHIISFAIAAAVIVMMVVQFIRYWSGYLITGYMGGCQARYYAPCLPALAFGVCELVCESVKKCGKIRERVVQMVTVLMGILLIYADFFYFVLSYYGSHYDGY